MKAILSALGLLLVLTYAIGSGIWVNTGDNWYANLNSPSWQPPDFVFGIIWPYNFIVIGLTAVIVANRSSARTASIFLAILALSVIAALTWAYQFYRPHNLQVASLALAIAALLTIPLTFISFKTSTPIGIAFLPYQAWIITAAVLSSSYATLNS
jgi:tryptophan-rich sensory protein